MENVCQTPSVGHTSNVQGADSPDIDILRLLDLPPAGVRGRHVLGPGGRHGQRQAGHGRGDGRPGPRQAGGGGGRSAGSEEFPPQQFHQVLCWSPGQGGAGPD